MSEDFDKEAERERLREKYEKDKKKREATEQMSELLLQGATMTNAHCSTCSDPIFRYDGQEFCPTCEKPVDRDGSGNDTDDGNIEVTAPSEEAQVSFGENGTTSDTAEHSTADSTTQQQPTQTQQPQTQTQQPQTPEQSHPNTQQPGQNHPQQASQSHHRHGQEQQASTREIPSIDPGAATIQDATQSLVRTLTRFSKQAEAADDPRQATDNLEAAREAAETLAALRR